MVARSSGTQRAAAVRRYEAEFNGSYSVTIHLTTHDTAPGCDRFYAAVVSDDGVESEGELTAGPDGWPANALTALVGSADAGQPIDLVIVPLQPGCAVQVSPEVWIHRTVRFPTVRSGQPWTSMPPGESLGLPMQSSATFGFNPFTICSQAPTTCAANTTCAGGECTCTPACEGNVCGPDGCGGSCGLCANGGSCSGSGQCANVVSPPGCPDVSFPEATDDQGCPAGDLTGDGCISYGEVNVVARAVQAGADVAGLSCDLNHNGDDVLEAGDVSSVLANAKGQPACLETGSLCDTACAPDLCLDQTCGEDGCGLSCGGCEEGLICADTQGTLGVSAQCAP